MIDIDLYLLNLFEIMGEVWCFWTSVYIHLIFNNAYGTAVEILQR